MKKVLFILFCGILSISMLGCEMKTNLNQLNEIQEEVTNNVSKQSNYTNFASCYVDLENHLVVVELIDNSKEQQDWFKANILNSKYLKFVQGGPYTTLDETCLESLLGGYITSEMNTLKDKNITDLIEVDMQKIQYSKVKITDNGFLYAIVKTDDSIVETNLDKYFIENYSGYKKVNFDKNYLVYLYNKDTSINLEEELKICQK